MSIRGLKKWALLLTFWLALQTARLHAQLLGPYGTSPITFGVDSNGLVSATGTYGTGSLSLSGAGTRMFWYPGKAAFRAGRVSGTQWDDANVGAYSVALGYNAEASANDAIAMGSFSSASGNDSVALGSSTQASGGSSIALGTYSEAIGSYSAAIGIAAYAEGDYSFAGSGSYTSGVSATAFSGGTASGYSSIALGALTNASGDYSTASGYYITASAFSSFTAGRCNIGGGNPTSWVATDPLFEIGNGTSSSSTADALIVYKNGNTKIYGADNELPNQTLVNSHSILTEGLADSRYVASAGTSLTLPLVTSVAIGGSTSATGSESVALGYLNTASGDRAFTTGQGSTASGWTAVAIGLYNTASGPEAAAFNSYTTASGGAASAFGFNTIATGSCSIASGNSTLANSVNSVSIGQYNVGGGNATIWNSSDPLFEIGNGASDTARTDALIVYKNGNANLQGNLSTGGTVTATGALTAASVTTAGNVTASGTITASNVVVTAPGGDIPMYSGN